MNDLKDLCFAAINVVKKAGSFIKEERKRFDPTRVEHKGIHDLVSYVDKEAEKILVEGLQEILPGCGFITEENTLSMEGDGQIWIIDPLDGTTNFVHGLPCFCVSVGLMKGNEIILGIVFEVNQDECFYGWKDGGAWLNGNQIFVSKSSTLSASLLATGFPYSNYERMQPYMEVFNYCMFNTRGLRRLGSAAADLAYVACGRMDAFFEYGLSPWDVAGGILLIKEAGGKVADFSGGNDFLFGKEIVASNQDIYKEFLQIVKEKFSGSN